MRSRNRNAELSITLSLPALRAPGEAKRPSMQNGRRSLDHCRLWNGLYLDGGRHLEAHRDERIDATAARVRVGGVDVDGVVVFPAAVALGAPRLDDADRDTIGLQTVRGRCLDRSAALVELHLTYVSKKVSK